LVVTEWPLAWKWVRKLLKEWGAVRKKGKVAYEEVV